MQVLPILGRAALRRRLHLIMLALLPLHSALAHPANDYVILLAGLNGSTLNMKRIDWNLRRAGYHVINLPYRSHYGTIAQIADHYLPPVIARIPPSATIHFVTHSMGAIVLRQYLSNHNLPNLGRVVMIAPPNHGAEIADYFRRHWWGRLFLGPAGCELGTSPSDAPQRLGPPHFPFAVIAGDFTLSPLAYFILPGPSDGTIPVNHTQLPGMNAFLIIHSRHTLILWRKQTVRAVLSYLNEGVFHGRSTKGAYPCAAASPIAGSGSKLVEHR